MTVYKTSYGRFNVILLAVLILFISGVLALISLLPDESAPALIYVIMGIVLTLLLWMALGTHYVVTDRELLYRSGPFRGKIAISKIRKLEYDDRFFKQSLLRLGMDTKGLTVHYDKFEDIYISPRHRDAFVAELCRLNPEIIVTVRQ